jgi:hypothetical protein
MKRYFVVTGLLATALVFYNCHSAKKAQAAAPAPTTYEASIKPLVMANCTPCHIPSKGGNKKAYDNYANAKADIDNMIRRIELNPTDKGFMPFKHPKLSDSTIAVFKQWRTEGLKEM